MIVSGSGAAPRPSLGYLYTICSGCIGLTFLGPGLGGAVIGWSGGDPVRAFDVVGMVMFLLGFAILFAMRLIFWPPVPQKLRVVVRSLITVFFVAAAVASLVGVALAFQLLAAVTHRAVPMAFSLLALAAQPGAILWLIRYRREGL